MKSSYLQICRMLASSGYREQDIEDFIYEVKRRSPGSVIEDIDEIRRFMRTSISFSRSDMYAPKKNNFITADSDTVMKIERLLLMEAGLSKSAAVEILYHELQTRFPNTPIPHESKKGFYSWLEKLTNLIPEKDLLYIATNIRNRSVHDLPIDWRLK